MVTGFSVILNVLEGVVAQYHPVDNYERHFQRLSRKRNRKSPEKCRQRNCLVDVIKVMEQSENFTSANDTCAGLQNIIQELSKNTAYDSDRFSHDLLVEKTVDLIYRTNGIINDSKSKSIRSILILSLIEVVNALVPVFTTWKPVMTRYTSRLGILSRNIT